MPEAPFDLDVAERWHQKYYEGGWKHCTLPVKHPHTGEWMIFEPGSDRWMWLTDEQYKNISALTRIRFKTRYDIPPEPVSATSGFRSSRWYVLSKSILQRLWKPRKHV